MRPELIFCAVCLVGCARPTIDEGDGDDSGAPVVTSDAAAQPVTQPDARVDPPKTDPDAGIVTAPPRDASQPVTVVDTGVAEDDGGDQLPPVLANCDATGIKSSVPLGVGTAGDVTINGSASTIATVKTGESVDIGVTVTFDTCSSGVYSAQSLFLGLNDGSGSAECKQTTGCSELSPVMFPEVDLNFTVTAPSIPGAYFVMAGLKATICVSGTGSASIADTPVATLCVTK